MWRYAAMFILSAILVTAGLALVGMLDSWNDGPLGMAVSLVLALVLLGHEIVTRAFIQDTSRRIELKELLALEPGYSRFIYLLGLVMGAATATLCVVLSRVLASNGFAGMLPILFPIIAFPLGQWWGEKQVKHRLKQIRR